MSGNYVVQADSSISVGLEAGCLATYKGLRHFILKVSAVLVNMIPIYLYLESNVLPTAPWGR